MSDRGFRLLLHNEEAGFAVARPDGSWRWWLTDDWMEKPEPPVLSLHLQNRSLRGTRSESRTPWFLSNLLPEPESALRRRLARTHDVPVADDAALLAVLGADMSGALQAIPTDEKPPAPPVRASVERAPLAGYRASLGGMQLKFSANFKDHVTLPAHGETGMWILKLPPRDQPTLPALEATAMEWARAVGFQVPEVRVVASALIEGLPDDLLSQVASALLVRRFDRPNDRLRVHMEEVNSALGFHPVEKYPGEGSPSDSRRPTTHTATSIGRVFRRFAMEQAAATFVQRWVFDALVGNGDAHLKNWAFVFPDGRRGAIAPVYDVVPTVLRGDSTTAVPLFGHELRGENRFTSVTPSAIRELAKKLSLDPDAVEADARSLVDRAMATFPGAAEPFDLGDEARRWRQHQEDVARAWT